jgi:hypothetical protein
VSTYYVDGADGDDGNAGTSEGSGNAWATIDKAMNTVAAGDIVFVKSSATYTELVTIDTVGTTTAPILFIGYTTTADRTDRGKVTIDAESSRANCIVSTLTSNTFYVFENFILKNATGNGYSAINADQMTFRNCEFNDNGGNGLVSDNGLMVESCIFSGNASDGIDCDANAQIYGSRFLSNGTNGVTLITGVVWGCTFFDSGSAAITFLGSNTAINAVINCTIDGNSKTSTTGIRFGTSFWGPYAAINNIIYDCITGIDGYDNGGGRFIGRNNLLNSNTTDYDNTGYETLVGEVTGAPAFTDEAANDYTLGAGSPALNAGFDGYETGGTTQRADIGAFESTAAGGGGGGVSPSKRAGKQ